VNTRGRIALGALAAIVIIAAIALLNQPQSLVAVAPTASLAVTPTASLPPTASPAVQSPTPIATPEGFALPEGCSYAGGPTRTATSGEWRFTCGGGSDSLERVRMALTQQGWNPCAPSPGIYGAWKGQFTIRLTAATSPSDNPYLLEYPRDATGCQ
jgi:hypothetical protein